MPLLQGGSSTTQENLVRKTQGGHISPDPVYIFSDLVREICSGDLSIGSPKFSMTLISGDRIVGSEVAEMDEFIAELNEVLK